MTSANNKYTFKEPRRQCFAFPSDVISHLLMNPKSGNGLEKLYQTCKYFFSKTKILVFKHYGRIRDNILYCTFNQSEKKLKCQVNIGKIQASLWLAGELVITSALTTIFKTIYRCSVWRLVLLNITLSYNDFKFFVAENNVKDFDFRGASIYYNDNRPVTLDVILKNLPNVEEFWYHNKDETFSEKTLRKMTQIPLNIKLNYCLFYIVDISNNFNPTLLCKFFDQHPMCTFKVYIVNARSPEIKENIETALKNITGDGKEKKLKVTVYAE